MSKKKHRSKSRRPAPVHVNPPASRGRWWMITLIVVLGVGGVVLALKMTNNQAPTTSSPNSVQEAPKANATPAAQTTNAPPDQPPAASWPSSAPGAPQSNTMEVAQAIMVTVELNFGPKVPSIAEAVQQIDRRYEPEDGFGRTFAILDAYGEPTPDGKLHISMHVSSEKPGKGWLAFKPTGEVLWTGQIVPGSKPGGKPQNLGIWIDNGAGKALIVDGSNNPSSILGAKVQGTTQLVRDVWPDGAEREVTFMYSACGCPVKAMVRRVGDRTVRTKDLPVLFPDDPAAVNIISRLMRW